MPMKFTATKQTLIALIQPTLTAVSGKSTLPALEGLLFTLEGNTLSVCGYDLEKGVKSSGEVYGLGDGAVILNAQKISSIVKNFQDCNITFEADAKNVVKITGGASDFSIHGLTSEAFPNLPELGGDKKFAISQGLLKEIIGTTHFAVAQSDARPILMGELFRVEGRKLTVVALDNYRLAMREEENAIFNNSSNFSFVVPGTALVDFAKFLEDNEELIEIEFTNKYIIMKVEDNIFFSRLLEGDFLDYNKAIPTNSKIFVNIKKDDFLESVTRASLLVDEKLKTPLRCRFSGDILNISCSTQYGTVSDNVEAIKEGEDIEIGFNSRYLLDALRNCKDEYVKVALTSPLMSMVITPEIQKADSRYIFLVLPCHLKG